jgi:hypothetical protein
MDENVELEHIQIKPDEIRDESAQDAYESIWDILKRAPRIEEDLFERDSSPAREIDL